MKISEIIKSAVRKLQQVGVESAQLDARILLEHAIKKDRSFLIANSDYEITEVQNNEFEKLLQRRINREPISHILETKEFWGRNFKVSSDVLTPRPETEHIIEAALKYYKPSQTGEKYKILDLGTGSGCILLTLLQEIPNSEGLGVDISKTALAIAKDNAYNQKVNNAEFILSEWCENLTQKHFNLIVSNPPYIPLHDLKSLEKELSFEPKNALFAGNDGLDDYRKIAEQIKFIGFDYAIFEIGFNQENEVKEIFSLNGMNCIEVIKDLAGISRSLVFIKSLGI